MRVDMPLCEGAVLVESVAEVEGKDTTANTIP